MKIVKNMKRNFSYVVYLFLNKIRNAYNQKIIVLSAESAIQRILKEQKSLCRFGDGEFELIFGNSIKFQSSDQMLANRLKSIINSNSQECLICIPDIFNNLNSLKYEDKKFWTIQLGHNYKKWRTILNYNNQYYDAFISRPYMMYKDNADTKNKFTNLKNIWDERNIILVEGKYSRLGIGNDLFDNVKNIKRIICPSKDAYNYYDEILSETKALITDELVLIALGPTATVLAYDLSNLGYQAIDIGHIDIEYEWFINNAQNKEVVLGKSVNEVNNNIICDVILCENYASQIIKEIN